METNSQIPGLPLLHRFYPESRFGNFSDADVDITFYLRINALLNSESVVLDVGCGRGAYGKDPIPLRKSLHILKGKCERVIGIDVDPGANANPYIDEFRLIRGNSWPIENESIDLAIADYVVEHVTDPESFFGELV